ncbi:MAG: family 43 glycosylhydrolase [Lachnospiraceae bacterium]|nr:family 43 glycosylhydrolase [Lachnospiraceae bacterium]
MKKQGFNPILPLSEYIPDGEPHVFGDRVYLFGSHDQAGGNTYCMLDYEFWSAPVNDLSNWSCRGVSYSAVQDPQYGGKLRHMYAPDVVQGNDGKFYLYYCMSGEKGAGCYGRQISVAVCDTPDGKYEYYGFVRNPDGSPMLKYVTFDPAVINDDGVIRLYYGTWFPFHEHGILLNPIFHRIESRMFGKSVPEIRAYRDGIMGANHVVLAGDMLTIKTEPCHILPNHVKGTPFDKHPFFEGSSIRKIGSTYYFIYSSIHGHELCYATSRCPDREFTYGGTIVSNGDVGYQGRAEKDRLNATGTNHGSIECIHGQWYVFYHRNTNKTAYSRQACAESVEILPDGRIPQVEITTQGLHGKPLKAAGTFPAAICCGLTNGKMPHQGNGIIQKDIPYVSAADSGIIVTAGVRSQIIYKYFDFAGARTITVRARGKGVLEVFGETLDIASDTWNSYVCPLHREGVQELIFSVLTGRIELLDFTFGG